MYTAVPKEKKTCSVHDSIPTSPSVCPFALLVNKWHFMPLAIIKYVKYLVIWTEIFLS